MNNVGVILCDTGRWSIIMYQTFYQLKFQNLTRGAHSLARTSTKTQHVCSYKHAHVIKRLFSFRKRARESEREKDNQKNRKKDEKGMAEWVKEKERNEWEILNERKTKKYLEKETERRKIMTEQSAEMNRTRKLEEWEKK